MAAYAADAKLSVSGAALAAILSCCGASEGDCDGLLFGRAALLRAPPPSLIDDAPAPAPAALSLSISISGHASLAHPYFLSDPLGRFQLRPSSATDAVVGFFSSRRRGALWSSMREAALARSLSKSLALTHPVLLLLVSLSSSTNRSVQSLDYRAFLLAGSRLVPVSLHVVNLGSGFRDQYDSFAAETPMLWMPPLLSPAGGYSIGDEKAMDAMVDGFGLKRAEGMMSDDLRCCASDRDGGDVCRDAEETGGACSAGGGEQ